MAKKTSKTSSTSSKKSETTNDRHSSIEAALKSIKTKFGDDSIMLMGEQPQVDVGVIPTGSLALDHALGIGGLPRGRVVEVFGPESSGKTTLALHVVAQAQAAGGIAAFIDAEHAMDPQYAQKLGVDINDLLLSQPNSGEQALEIVESLVRTGTIDVIVVDSVAALTPSAEIEGDMSQQHVGIQARLMSKALRKLTAIISDTKTVVVFINQIREKIGVMFGSPETTPGGRALKFYSSVRIDIRRIAQIKKGDQVIGARTRIKIVKNKVAAPFKQVEVDLLYNEGFAREGEILTVGEKYKVIEKSGAMYRYEGETLGRGYDAARQFLKENKKVADKIIKELKTALAGDTLDASK